VDTISFKLTKEQAKLLADASKERGFPSKSEFVRYAIARALEDRLSVKTIEDIEGDKKDGAVTLPIRIGERPSAYIASVIGFLAILLSPVPLYMRLFNEYYLLVVALADITFLYAIYQILKKSPTVSSKYYKVGMFFALIAFIAGSFLK